MTNNSKKIPPHLDGYLDNYILNIIKYINPYFKTLNFTPNHITTLSLIYGFMSIFFLYKDDHYFSVLALLVSYFFDCQDGNYARQYNMVTKNGDIYDHIKDFIVFIFLIYILLNKIDNPIIKYSYTVLIIIFLLFLNNYTSCTEKYMNKEDRSFTLGLISKCEGIPEERLKLLRHFCAANFTVLICILIILNKFIR